MTKFFAALCAFALTIGFTLDNAEAARVGAGRSMGVQRAAPMQRQAAPPAAAPQQAKPAAAAAPAAGNRWMGPLAGLAAGLGLGWLLSQGGLGGFGGMGGMLLMVLLAGGAALLFARMFARRASAHASASGPSFAVPNIEEREQRPGTPVATLIQPQIQPQIPAGFDAEAFLKHAKLNFLQLQEANDRADLTELREVTTPEMFQTLQGDVASRGSRRQQTEIIGLEATLLEVATERDLYWASVRFCGNVRESPNCAPETLDEVWNMQKPVNGQTGWLLAGIQQAA